MRLTILLAFLIAVGVSSQAFAAATVFFKDGSKEVGKTAWVEGNSVYLNKPGEVYEYSADEVNMDETLKYNRLGSYADKAIAAPEAQAPRETSERRQPTGKKEHRSKPAARAEEPAMSDNVSSERPFFGVQMPDDCTPCSSGLQAELMARFVKYNQAAEAGDFREFEKNIIEYQAEGSRKALAGLSKKELQERRKILQSLASKNYHATACLVTPNGKIAALAGRGTNEGKVNAHGSFLFRKEGEAWKMQSSVWNMSM